MPRKQHTHHYIYKTVCLVTNKFYIGMHSTSNLEDGYFGSGRILKRSLKKHGIENHIVHILEHLKDRNSLALREREIVNEDLLKDPKCMNLMKGGEGGRGFISVENQRNRSIAAVKKSIENRRNNPEKMRIFKEKVGARLKKYHEQGLIRHDTFTGRKHQEESKKKIGIANSVHQKGEGNSQFGTMWIYNLDLKECKKIKKEHFENYPNWIIGRRMHFKKMGI